MNKKTLIIFIVFTSFVLSNSRVSFTRPGSFMRISDVDNYSHNTLFSLAVGSEITSIGEITSHSSSFAYNKTHANGTSWGLSYTLLPYTGTDSELMTSNIDYEFGFHYQTQLYNTGRSSITIGIHDLLLNDDLININNLSFFMNFSNRISSEHYNLTSLLGIGTGKMGYDPHLAVASGTDSTTVGFYGAFKLNTPFLNKWGGVDLITEFIASSINIGLVIPLTNEYEFSFGLSHIENINEFSNQAVINEDERTPLAENAPAICLGLKINIPKINTNFKNTQLVQDYPILFINGRVDSSLFHAGQYIYTLQDSLSILEQEINNISSKNIELQLNNHYYKDSLNGMILKVEVNSATQNEAMRHLSKSLRLYYQGDFQQALQEVDAAIALQPNIAVAYARKGSIYYQLNQIDRATLNWNIALKLDPEYSEVRDMLNALTENKLRPVSTDK